MNQEGIQTYIAGSRTSDDWRRFSQQLRGSKDPSAWRQAADGYFSERLRLRYLEPISILQREGTFQGEGFSIMAIQCSLIEFLESTVRGLTYKYVRRGGKVGLHEYSSSRSLFVDFLTLRPPFAREFQRPLAESFYESVRCGLLHEAQTKGGWKIWARSPSGRVLDSEALIVFRDNFQDALLTFVEWYRTALLQDPELQDAFIRKFDGLASNLEQGLP